MMPSPRNATRLIGPAAMATTSRGLDSQPIAAREATERLGWEILGVEEVATGLPVASAVGAGGSVAAALGEQRVGHVGLSLELADDAVPAVVLAAAAAVSSHGVLDRAQRELELERLDRGVERVRHRDVHGARAV